MEDLPKAIWPADPKAVLVSMVRLLARAIGPSPSSVKLPACPELPSSETEEPTKVLVPPLVLTNTWRICLPPEALMLPRNKLDEVRLRSRARLVKMVAGTERVALATRLTGALPKAVNKIDSSMLEPIARLPPAT